MLEPVRAENPGDGHGAAAAPVVSLGQEPFCVDMEEEDEENDEKKRDQGSKQDIAVV